MSNMEKRWLAHTSVLSSCMSPCGHRVAFGTNFGTLLIYDIDVITGQRSSQDQSPTHKIVPDSTITISAGHQIQAMLSNSEYLLIGANGCLHVLKWTEVMSKKPKVEIVHLPQKRTFDADIVSYINRLSSEVNVLVSCAGSGTIFVGSGDGYIHLFDLSRLSIVDTIKCHDSSIFDMSVAGVDELLSCGADGKACFWDVRCLQNNSKPSLTFIPGSVLKLQRPSLGDWLTVCSVQPNDSDWFVAGGGPRLALWNKRAGIHTAVLEPKDKPDVWYPFVSQFSCPGADPKILAGGTSGSLLAWDHSGEQIFETALTDDPVYRLSRVLTMAEFHKSDKECVSGHIIAGTGPSVHLISEMKQIEEKLRRPMGVKKGVSKVDKPNYRFDNPPRDPPAWKKTKPSKRRPTKIGPSEVWFTGVPGALIQASKDINESSQGLVKMTSYSGPTRAVAIDCEFVGVGFTGKENALARASVVNQFGHILMDEFVRPREKITDYRTAVSGITPHHMRRGGPAKDFVTVSSAIAQLCSGRILVGHAVHNDLKVLMFSHPKRDIRDTSRYKPFRDMFNGRNPSLKALTERLLGVGVQKGEHDSVEDARATMRIYTSVKRVWEAQIKARLSGKPASEVRRLAEHLRLPQLDVGCNGGTSGDTEPPHRLKVTRMAKMSMDVASEFASGLVRATTTNGVTSWLPPPGSPMTQRLPSLVTARRRGTCAITTTAKKCSKRRERFIDKRIRMRKKRKSFDSSETVSSLF